MTRPKVSPVTILSVSPPDDSGMRTVSFGTPDHGQGEVVVSEAAIEAGFLAQIINAVVADRKRAAADLAADE